MPKSVLITGASRGIGAAIARLFAQQGYSVGLNYYHAAERAAALAKELTETGADVLLLPGNIADSKQAEKIVDGAAAAFGGLDVLVNNAGIAEQKLLTDITDDDWAQMLAVNLSGAFYCCRSAVPYMLRRQSGNIINISSMWGIAGASMETHYSAAKAGLIGFTKALAKELGPSHIRVNCVAPGVIDTEMNGALSEETLRSLADETPLGRLGTAQEVAEAVFFLVEKAAFITGQTLSVDGGFVL